MLTIMTPADYQRWLKQSASSESVVSAGETLFQSYGCLSCHRQGATVKAPSLDGLFGKPVPLAGGGTAVASESFIRDMILEPGKTKIAGYENNMPAYKGKIAEDDLVRIVAYIKSLGANKDQAND